jgi:hypothetical protein
MEIFTIHTTQQFSLSVVVPYEGTTDRRAFSFAQNCYFNSHMTISILMVDTQRNFPSFRSIVIIFHFRTLNVSDMPPPTWRRPNQHFIFFEVESPVHTYLPALLWPFLKSYFNRTMTYRRDSDVVYLETHVKHSKC